MNAVEKKLLFIVNPRAGKTKSRAPLFDAVSIFSKAGYLVRVAETRRHGDATELAERFGGDFDLVVCHGGDGTLNETVNGIMRLPREKRPPLSYLPGGSTNDFAASLSISSDPALAAQSAMRLQPRDLDVGVFNEKNFVYVASFGAFTRTAYTVPQDIKNMFGHFAYLLEGVKDLETALPLSHAPHRRRRGVRGRVPLRRGMQLDLHRGTDEALTRRGGPMRRAV